MATGTSTPQKRDLHTRDAIESHLLDMRGLLTCAQAMQENIWDYAELKGLNDCAGGFQDALTVCLGMMSKSIDRLLEEASNV